MSQNISGPFRKQVNQWRELEAETESDWPNLNPTDLTESVCVSSILPQMDSMKHSA